MLTPYDFTTGWSQRLASEMQQWEEVLVREDAHDMLARVGITSKLRAIQSHDGSVRVHAVRWCSAWALR